MSTPFLPEFRRFLVQEPFYLERDLISAFTKTSLAVNQREIGTYDTIEVPTGKQYFPAAANQNKRDIFRKVFSIGSVNAGATSNTAHSISNLSLVSHLYGVAATASSDFRPLPYASVTANANIELRVDATNITIINGASSPNISSATVVIEYYR
jgi:hypothetical protein